MRISGVLLIWAGKPLFGLHDLAHSIDIHSNGIRLSITDLSPPMTRVLPTVYFYRNKISLYDAQYDEDGNRKPVSDETIDAVIAMLLRFQIFCTDFQVHPDHIQIVATEATRTAINSEHFLKRIKDEAGLEVQLLSKEQEGLVGAWGVASSFQSIRGLVLDLGGGSTQITWMITKDGVMQTSPLSAISFPYGAAALTKKLEDITKGKSKSEAKKSRNEFREEVKTNFQQAYEKLQIPEDMVEDAKSNGGFPLYLTGGGFRGWGYLLLHQQQVKGRGYPISIINGFTAHKNDFQDTEKLKKVAKQAHKIFRVSDRRRAQVPAVAFLINVLAEAIPNGIREAHFCQGGVREGVLFSRMPQEIRAQDPLEVATRSVARPLAPTIAKLLLGSLPSFQKDHHVPKNIDKHIIGAFANMFYFHANMSKEVSSTSALYSTSTGILASTHGVSHTDRALLAIMLEVRYEGELAPRETDYRSSLYRLLTDEEIWWARYIGTLGLILSRAYPAGTIQDGSLGKPQFQLSSRWTDGLGKIGDKTGLLVSFTLAWQHDGMGDPMKIKEEVERHVQELVKVGKKKRAVHGWKIKIAVEVEDSYPSDG